MVITHTTAAAQKSLVPLLGADVLPLLAIADTKLVLGNWHIVCLFNSKALPDYAALLAMAGASLGHARALYGHFANLNVDTVWLERERGPDAIHSLAVLDQPPANWADYMATLYVVEHATWLLAAGYLQSDDRALAALARRIGEDSYFHIKFATGWFGQLAQDPVKAQQARTAIAQRYGQAIEWFNHINEGLAATALKQQFRQAIEEAIVRVTPQGVSSSGSVLSDAPTQRKHDQQRAFLRSEPLPASLYERIRFKDAEAA